MVEYDHKSVCSFTTEQDRVNFMFYIFIVIQKRKSKKSDSRFIEVAIYCEAGTTKSYRGGRAKADDRSFKSTVTQTTQTKLVLHLRQKILNTCNVHSK